MTGDHVLTALAVARACGMVREDEDIIVGDVVDAPLPPASAAAAVAAAAAADVSWTNFSAASTKGAAIDLTTLSCGKVPQVGAGRKLGRTQRSRRTVEHSRGARRARPAPPCPAAAMEGRI